MIVVIAYIRHHDHHLIMIIMVSSECIVIFRFFCTLLFPVTVSLPWPCLIKNGASKQNLKK